MSEVSFASLLSQPLNDFRSVNQLLQAEQACMSARVIANTLGKRWLILLANIKLTYTQVALTAVLCCFQVTIPFGWNLVVDESPPPLLMLDIQGNVTFSTTEDVTLQVDEAQKPLPQGKKICLWS